MERQLDCALFERQSSGIELTADGQVALERFSSALAHLDEVVLKQNRFIALLADAARRAGAAPIATDSHKESVAAHDCDHNQAARAQDEV